MFVFLDSVVFYNESEYSRRRNSKAVWPREKREKEEYSECLRALLRSGAPVKTNQSLSDDLLQTFPTCQGNAKGSCHNFGDEI